MPTLTITRGYPASGKTTAARDWVARDPERRIRLNRDDVRQSMFGRAGVLPFTDEQLVTQVQQSAARAALTAGKDVMVDDTNLRLRFARQWADLALAAGSDFRVLDFPTPVDECVKRDSDRAAASGRYVGEQAIRDIADRFPIGRWPDVTPSERAAQVGPRWYEPNESLPAAWLVDVDGTLANMGARQPHDLTRVAEDTCHTTIADLVALIRQSGNAIVVMSGRDESSRADTQVWLDHHLGDYDELHMRPAGDRRPDYLIKAELFDQHVRDRWHVIAALDDRDQVVRMWRAMGLTCLQVADGDF